ncbi:thioredoxin, partial [Planktomarina temperata]|nr:thioredoxin [Planktomarina temperata]
EVADDVTASQAAVANMPGAFGKHTTFNMLNWVVEHGYDGEESFQKYHARKFAEQS